MSTSGRRVPACWPASSSRVIAAGAVAGAIAFAIGQPAEVDVSEIVVRPTAQG